MIPVVNIILNGRCNSYIAAGNADSKNKVSKIQVSDMSLVWSVDVDSYGTAGALGSAPQNHEIYIVGDHIYTLSMGDNVLL